MEKNRKTNQTSGKSRQRTNLKAKELPIIQPTRVSSNEVNTVAAGFVHEVKNPLAALHLHLQLLETYIEEVQKDELRSKLESKIQFIKQEITNLDQSMRSLLMFIKKTRNINIKNVSVNKVILEVLDLIRIQAERQCIEIEFVQGDLPRVNYLDPTLLRQIILNLLLNGIQALRKTNKSKKTIKIYTSIKHDSITIEIHDNGPGMSKKILDKAFKPFFSTDNNSGIGLSLVKSMVTSMGGTLKLETKLGEKTCFIMNYPKPNKYLPSVNR